MRTTIKKLLKNSKQKVKNLNPKKKPKAKVENPSHTEDAKLTSVTEQLKEILTIPSGASKNTKRSKGKKQGMEGVANIAEYSKDMQKIARDASGSQDLQSLASEAAHLYVKYIDFFSLEFTDNEFYQDFMGHYKYGRVFYQNFDYVLSTEELDNEYQNLLFQQDIEEFTSFFARHPELTNLVITHKNSLLLIASNWYEVYYPEIDFTRIFELIEEQVSLRQSELDEYKLDKNAIVKQVASQVVGMSKQMSEVYLEIYAISHTNGYTNQQIELEKIYRFNDKNKFMVKQIEDETVQEYAANTPMACESGTYKTLTMWLKDDDNLLSILKEVPIEMSKHGSLHYPHTMRECLAAKLKDYFAKLNIQIMQINNHILNYNILQVSDKEILAKIPANCELDIEQSVKLTNHFSTIINKKFISYCFNLPCVYEELVKFIDEHAAHNKHKTLAQIGKEELTPQDFVDLKMIRAVIENNLGLKRAAPVKELLKVLVVLAQNPHSGKNKDSIDYQPLITKILLAMFREDINESAEEIQKSFDDFLDQNIESLSIGTKMYLLRKMQKVHAINSTNLSSSPSLNVDTPLLQALLTRYHALREFDEKNKAQANEQKRDKTTAITQKASKQKKSVRFEEPIATIITFEEPVAKNEKKPLPPLPAIPQKIRKPLPATPAQASKQDIAETESPVIVKKSFPVFFTPQTSFETTSSSPGFCTPQSSSDSQSPLFFTPQSSPQRSFEKIPESNSLGQIIKDLDDLDNLLEEIIKLDTKNIALSNIPKR